MPFISSGRRGAEMSEKRRRTTTVHCTDEVWSSFQALAAKRGTTLSGLLGEVVEHQVAAASNDQATLARVLEDERTETDRRGRPQRTLIGFGQPVVRIR
jgi:hypothetical protein